MTGPDNIHPHLLKTVLICLLFQFHIFQKSFQDTSLPDIWKSATVIPLFKKGSKLDPGNYKPVSLTCVSCKIMESIIRDHIAAWSAECRSVCQQANAVSPKEDLVQRTC